MEDMDHTDLDLDTTTVVIRIKLAKKTSDDYDNALLLFIM